MSFNLKTNPISISIKLTNAGRERLSNGSFNVTHFSVGDSEIDYNFIKKNDFDGNKLNTLLPYENNTEIRYKIKRSFNDTEVIYPVAIYPIQNKVYNEINTGFFDGKSLDSMSFNRDISRVKESGLKIDVSTLSSNTSTVSLIKDDDYQAGAGVEVGDYVLIGWTNPYMNQNNSDIITQTVYHPYLFYKIESVSGSIGGDNLTLGLDREVPNFGSGISGSTYYAFCFIYPKYDSIINYYGTEFLSDFWGFTDDNYIENQYCSNNRVHVWNYTLFYPEKYIGVTDSDKIPNELYSYKYKSFLSYISANSKQDVYGIVHYTNSLPDNNMGECFFENSAELWLPTLMWHKNKETKIGTRFICQELPNTIIESTLKFYNLLDESGNIVGKCFPDLKIFLIEDQELVQVLAFKSNRNWTLPKPKIGLSGLNC